MIGWYRCWTILDRLLYVRLAHWMCDRGNTTNQLLLHKQHMRESQLGLTLAQSWFEACLDFALAPSSSERPAEFTV